MKNIVFFLIAYSFTGFLTFLNAQEMNPEMVAFMAKMDGTNLEELEKELDRGIEGLRAFADFFEGTNSDGIKSYTKEEERFEEPFKIDTSDVWKSLSQFKNIGFTQTFKENKSYLKFNKIGDDYWHTQWMEEGMKEKFIPNTIFYKDGTSLSKGISENELSFYFENPWGDIAVIDSIRIDYNIHYMAAYDSLKLRKNSKKIKYKDGIIKVEKLEKNHLYLTVSDKYAYGLYVRALNAEGKILNQNSSSYSPMPDGKSKEGFGEMLRLLEEIQTKLKANKFKDTESLKKHLLKKVAKIESVKDKDGVYHKKYYFEGNVESVQVYIQTEEKSKTISFTAKNTSNFGEIILMQSETENIFLDASAKELFKTPLSSIQSLGSRYFQNDSLYYHLNLKTKKLDELKVAYIWEATNGLAFIQKTKEDNLLMYNSEHELLSDMTFKQLYAIDKYYVQGIDTQNENFFLSETGAIKKLEGINDIRDPFDGRMAAKSNGKYGFIANSGEVVIPFKYSEVENFKEGHAIVSNEENKFGIIDTNGKTVIPLIYRSILSHDNGFTWVSTDDAFQLLRNGKVILTEEGGSYSMSKSNSEITLQFGDKKYDGYGNPILDSK